VGLLGSNAVGCGPALPLCSVGSCRLVLPYMCSRDGTAVAAGVCVSMHTLTLTHGGPFLAVRLHTVLNKVRAVNDNMMHFCNPLRQWLLCMVTGLFMLFSHQMVTPVPMRREESLLPFAEAQVIDHEKIRCCTRA
jgi:hypothetical protein